MGPPDRADANLARGVDAIMASRGIERVHLLVDARKGDPPCARSLGLAHERRDPKVEAMRYQRAIAWIPSLPGEDAPAGSGRRVTIPPPASLGGDVRFGGVYDVCSIARDDEREGLVARFAVVRRERMQSRR